MKYLVSLLLIALLTACGGGAQESDDWTQDDDDGYDYNVAPVAVASAYDAQVPLGQMIRLIGSASFDADHDPLYYHWNLYDTPAGETALFSGGNTAMPQFQPTRTGTYKFTLYVSDGKDYSDDADINVEVVAPLQPGVGGTARSDADRSQSYWAYDAALQPSGAVAIRLTSLPTWQDQLVIECANNAVQNYYLQTTAPILDSRITYQIGTNSAVTETWLKDGSKLYPAAPNMEFLRKLFVNTDFRYTASGIFGSTQGGLVRLAGLPATVDATRNLCGWPQDSFPAGNGWSAPLPTTIPADAKEGTNDPTAFASGVRPSLSGEYFRVLAWKAVNARGKTQLIVRAGDAQGPCAGTLGASPDSYFAVQDGRTIALTTGTSFANSCTAPAVYALNGDYDPDRPFTLQVYTQHVDANNRGKPFTALQFG